MKNSNTKNGVQADNRFAIIPHWIIFSKISDSALRLYAVLTKYANNSTGEAWPSRSSLAKDIRKSEKTVDRAIKELQSIGALQITRRYRAGTKENLSNLYTIITANPDMQSIPDSMQVEDDSEVASPMSPRGATNVAENYTHLTTPTSITPPNKNPGHRLHPRTSVQGSEYKPDPVSQQFRRSIERDKMIRHIQYVAQRKIDGANPEEIDDLMGTFVDYCSHVFKTDEHLDHLIYDMNWQPSKNHATKYEAAAWLNQLLYVWHAEIGELTFHPIETAA